MNVRKITGVVVLAALAGVSCTRKSHSWLDPNLAIPLTSVSTLSYEGVIFPEERANEAVGVGKVSGYWTPSALDVEELESKLQAFLKRAQADPTIASPWIRKHPERGQFVSREIKSILEHYSRFRRQYVGVVVSGSKRVFVNCFPGPREDGQDSHDYWHRTFVLVSDGGFWYWNVQYDVDTKEFVSFRSNGYA